MAGTSVTIKTSKDALAASQQREGEVEATLAECRNRVETLDSKIPNLQGEKKRAVAAKNFKAAGTISADIKRFTAEKEEAQNKLLGIASKVIAAAKEQTKELDKQRVALGNTTGLFGQFNQQLTDSKMF